MTNKITFNLNKKIGRVLFIVEGETDELYILRKIFTEIFDYQYESRNRIDKYWHSDLVGNPTSSVFVINSKHPNISSIQTAEDYLDDMFQMLIEDYKFPVHKAAIFYLFDRDVKSNTDKQLIIDLMKRLNNSRDSNRFHDYPGLLLLSYPAIESFTASHFIDECINQEYDLGKNLKVYLGPNGYTNQRITDETLLKATKEMIDGLKSLGIFDFDLDDFYPCNQELFDYQENHYVTHQKYRLISLICMALIDLGLLDIVE